MIKVGHTPIIYKHYNDNTFFGRIDCSNYDPNDPITWLFDSEEEFLPFYFIVQHFRDKIDGCHELNLPYVPSARMDRCKNEEDIFTLKYMAQLINKCNFDKVNIFDAHSRVTSALLNHVYNQSPIPMTQSVLDRLPKDTIIGFCDEGGLERYREMPMFSVWGIKQRNWENQKIEKLVLGGSTHMIAGHPILLVDDILARGSTIYHMAKALKERGATDIYVYVSHCENTVLGPHINGRSLLEIPNLIEKVYTTNSIWRGKNPKVEVIYRF